MSVIIITVVIQGILAPKEERGSFDTNHLFINDGIFQAIGVISFGMARSLFPIILIVSLVVKGLFSYLS